MFPRDRIQSSLYRLRWEHRDRSRRGWRRKSGSDAHPQCRLSLIVHKAVHRLCATQLPWPVRRRGAPAHFLERCSRSLDGHIVELSISDEVPDDADDGISPSFLVRARALMGNAQATLTWGGGNTIARGRARRVRPCSCDAATLRHLLDFLHREGVIGTEKIAARRLTPAERCVQEYAQYLRDARALARTTIRRHYFRLARYRSQSAANNHLSSPSHENAGETRFVS
jgi:hypothetical protein